MEEFAIMIAVIGGCIIALLPIVLFFKVWGMCNNVKAIRELLERKTE